MTKSTLWGLAGPGVSIGGRGVRGLLLLAFLAALVPLAFAMPYVGALSWAWLSFANPHRETFGYAFDFHIVIGVAIACMAGWFFSRKPGLVLADRTVVAMILFVLWTGLSTAAAFDPAYSFEFFIQTAKSFILAIVLLGLLNNKTRIHALILVIAISIGYYAVKGFGFTLLTGGQFRVLGPDGTQIGDNNDLGLALAMSLPLLNYLRISSRHVIVTGIVTFVMVATLVAIIGTYSRGGLVGLAIVGLIMWFQSRHKIILTVALAGVLIALPTLVPRQWYDRMTTIETYQEDESFSGREQAWKVSTRIALDHPLVGGGFKVTELAPVFMKYNYDGDIKTGKAAHSIYFQVLGEHGFVGLALYLVMVAIGFLNLWDVMAAAKRREDLRWIRDLAGMMQVAFIGVMSAGALLSMAYYDVFLALLALSARMRIFVREVDVASAEVTAPGWRRSLTTVTAFAQRSTGAVQSFKRANPKPKRVPGPSA